MRTMRRMAVVALAFASIWSTSLPVFAQDDQKSELTQIIRQEDDALHAMAVDKLMSFNLSPAWWQYLLTRDNRAYRTISNIASGLMDFGTTVGVENLGKLDESHDATSPLVADAMAKLQSKVHCTIELVDDVKPDARARVIENVAMFQAPMTNSYYCKPRGGKLHLFIKLNPKATGLQFQVSKDGNDYHFAIPAYMNLMTSPIQEAFKQGT